MNATPTRPRVAMRTCPLCGASKALRTIWTEPKGPLLTRLQFCCDACGVVLRGYTEIILPAQDSTDGGDTA